MHLHRRHVDIYSVIRTGSLWTSTHSEVCDSVCSSHFISSFYRPKFASASKKLLNYHNNSAAVVFIHTHCCTEVHQTLFQRWLICILWCQHCPSSRLLIKHPVSCLFLFSSVFSEKGKKRVEKKNLDSAALILFGRLVIGVYVIGFYSVRCFPHKSLSI